MILEKDCTVFWQATAFFPAMNLSTQGSSGLTDFASSDWSTPIVVGGGLQIGLMQGGIRQGKKYEVLNNPGSTITLTCSPSVNVQADSGTVMASLSYNAAVIPVTINLIGVRKVDGTTYALTGAQVTATLNAGPFQIDEDSYKWSIGGGVGAFYDYFIGFNASYSKLIPIRDLDAKFEFYTKKNGNATITCTATVTLAINPGIPFVLNVQAKKDITSVKPTAPKWDVDTGAVVLDSPNNAGRVIFGNDVRYLTSKAGQYWTAQVVMPDPFGMNGGTCFFAQLVTPFRTEDLLTDGQMSTIKYNLNGITGLDIAYPYRNEFAVGAEGNDQDSPSQDFDLAKATQIVVRDRMQTWLMCKPAPLFEGQHVVAIPLKQYSWGWSATVTRRFDATLNQYVYDFVSRSPTPPGENAPPPATLHPEDTDDHPLWDIAHRSILLRP